MKLEADDNGVNSESPTIEGCGSTGNAQSGIGLTESERSDDGGSQTDVHSAPLHHSVGPSNGSESDSLGDGTTPCASFSTDNQEAGPDSGLPYPHRPL